MASLHVIDTRRRISKQGMDDPFRAFPVGGPEFPQPALLGLIQPEIEAVDQHGGHHRMIQEIEEDRLRQRRALWSDFIGGGVMRDDRLKSAGPGGLDLIQRKDDTGMVCGKGAPVRFSSPDRREDRQPGCEHDPDQAGSSRDRPEPAHEGRCGSESVR